MSTSMKTVVTIGIFPSKEALIFALEQGKRCALTVFAKHMLKNDSSDNPLTNESYGLVICSAGELLRQQGPVKIGVLKKAVRRLNGLCPSQLAGYFCLQIEDLEEGEELYFMMEQIDNSNGYPCIFKIVKSDEKNVLFAFCAFNDTILDSNAQIAYVRRPS